MLELLVISLHRFFLQIKPVLILRVVASMCDLRWPKIKHATLIIVIKKKIFLKNVFSLYGL